MRTTFINQLVEEARHNDKIFLLVGDLGYNVVEPFANEFPNRYKNVGIAEQNMAGIAGGLAMIGYNVYIYSIGNFPTLRCIEQLRNDCAYYKGSVKVVAVGAGYAYAAQGVSHQATEDIAIMRAIPNMVVCSPSDPSETRRITTLSAHYEGPMYIRLGKAGEERIYKDSCSFTIGDFVQYKESKSENVLITTGSISGYAVNWLRENNIDTAMFTMPFIKPINKEQLKMIAKKYHNIIVLEEHQKSCGVGSAIIEHLSDLYSSNEILVMPKVRRIAINDTFIGIAGSQSYLRKYAGLQLSKDLFL